MEFLRVDDRLIEYQLVINKRGRKLSLQVKDGKTKVTGPPSVTTEQVQDFLRKNKDEIFEQLSKNAAAKRSPFQYVDGEKYMYRGRQYALKVQESEKTSSHVLLRGGQLIIFLPPWLESGEKAQATRSLIDGFYRESALKILEELVDYYSRLMDIPYKSLKIKNQRTRWGSCSNKGNINLNWRIIMAPNQVISYVVIHELSHLKHLDHSRDFWTLVGQYMPDYKRWKKWLAVNGETLTM